MHTPCWSLTVTARVRGRYRRGRFKRPWGQCGGMSPSRRTVPAPDVGEEVNNLPIQVSFVVPSTRGAEQVSNEHFRKRIKFAKKWFDSRFGGDTTTRAKGGYLAEDELIEEDVAVVESSMSIDTYLEKKDELADFIRERQQNWEQDTVMFKIEDRVFIYPQRGYIDDDKTVPEELIAVI